MNTINSRASYIGLMALAAFAVILGIVFIVGVAHACLWFLVPIVAGAVVFGVKQVIDIIGDLKAKGRA